MCQRILSLTFVAALALLAPIWLAGAAQAGPDLCPNSVIDPGETCDDGNSTSGDGCSADCLIEDCGDGIVTPDTEECDDDNSVGGDGCDALCQLECGNGTIEGAEDCDTSGESATCDDDCTVVDCGDTNVNQAANEECDDGNTDDEDACTNLCLLGTEPLPPDAQKCVNAVNKNWAGVLKASGADNAACLGSVAAAKSTFAACFGLDVKQKVSKAGAKTTATITKKCPATLVVDFALTDAATVNAAGDQEPQDAFTTVFGAAPTIADKKTAKDANKCQVAVIKAMNKLQDAYAAAANKAKKTLIKGGKGTPQVPLPVANPGELAAGLDTQIAADQKVVKATAAVDTQLTKKCTDALVDANFDCAGATTLVQLQACVKQAGIQAACNSLEAADALALSCGELP